MLIDRRDRKEDPYVDQKVWAFWAGAILAMVGIALNSRWIVGSAIAALGIGVLYRVRWALEQKFSEEGEEEEGEPETF